MSNNDNGMAPGIQDDAWHAAGYQRRLALVRAQRLAGGGVPAPRPELGQAGAVPPKAESRQQDKNADAASGPRQLAPASPGATGRVVMSARQFVETLCIAGFIAGGVIAISWEGWTLFGGLLSFGSVSWYFARGQDARGWIGPDRPQLEAEIRAAEIEVEGADAHPLKSSERTTAYKRAWGRLSSARRRLSEFDAEQRRR